MKNPIIKKDLKSNYLVYLIATIAIIILTIILTEGYPRFIDQYYQIVIFIGALAAILLFLLTLSLIVYILMNNFYTDKHQEFLPKVRSMRKYLYYRIVYAYVSLIYFLFVGLITATFTTELTLQMILEAINVTSVVIIINIALVYFCFLMASFFKAKYNFRIPVRVIITSILLILSMLTTLFVSVNNTFVEVIMATSISVAMAIVLLATIISTSKKDKKKFIVIDVLLVVLVLLIGFFFTYQEAYNSDSGYYDDYSEEGGSSGYGEKYEDTFTSSFAMIYEADSEIGKVTVFVEDEMNYTMYIDGEYKVVVNFVNSSANKNKNYMSFVAENYTTGEEISVDIYGGEGYSESYISTRSVNGDELETCEAGKTSEQGDDALDIESISCISDEQMNLIKQVQEEVAKSLEVINN